ncbi:hypothetical protein GCK32_010948 [Trichostrongylus colubriformis]|uniref:Uncharacterized protein n=1 Tax=Trichostrongylus colubriformis TaxID=6319 RepID=A0AAN8FPC2_TRICO
MPEDAADTTTSQGSSSNGPTEEERCSGQEPAPPDTPAKGMIPQRFPMDCPLNRDQISLRLTMESPSGPLAQLGLYPHSKTARRRLFYDILDTVERQHRSEHCDVALVKPEEVIDLTGDDMPTTSREQLSDETTVQPATKRRRKNEGAWAFNDHLHGGFCRHMQHSPQWRYVMGRHGMVTECYPAPRCGCPYHCSNLRPFRWSPHRSAGDRLPRAEQSPAEEPQAPPPTDFNRVPNELPLNEQFPFRVRYACQEAGCRSSLDQKNLMQHVEYHRYSISYCQAFWCT